MNLIDLALNSPIYIQICYYLNLKEINTFFIINKKIYENINNKKYTKKIMLQKLWENIDLINYYKNLFGEFEYNVQYHKQQHEIITKKLFLHKKITKIIN